MVEAYRDEHDCSMSTAMDDLKQRQKLARRANLLMRAEQATTFDELKAIVVEIITSNNL